MVNAASKLIRIEEAPTGAGVADRPRPGRACHWRRRRPGRRPVAAPVTDDYVGDPADRTGFGGLEAVDEVTMVASRT